MADGDTPCSPEPARAWQSETYAQAKENFRAACCRAGVGYQAYAHPLAGPDGDELTTDVAYFGPPTAPKLLVLVSGVHGLEGLSGSASQVGWIEQRCYDALPSDVAVLMIHMINPWGCAFRRRFTEDNVDLCRNFVDFSLPLPENPAYAVVHSELLDDKVLGRGGSSSEHYLSDRVQEYGIEHVVDLFMGGQYQFPNGFGFGGAKPGWSNDTLHEILAARRNQLEDACIIEFHTGLGAWAYGQIICFHQEADLRRARDWFGPWLFNPNVDRKPGERGYRAVPGLTLNGYERALAGVRLTAVTLEFGSYPSDLTLALLLREHYLTQVQPGSRELEQVRLRLQEYHHPADWEWRCAFWDRSQQVVRQAIRGMLEESGEL